MKRISIVLLLIGLLPATLSADEAVQREMEQDTVLRALVDELERCKAGLALEDLERPYFIEYGLTDYTGGDVSAELGAVTSKDESRHRQLRADVRVGSYELDNTNFSDGYGGYYRGFGRQTPVPLEDDYNAIRQAVWWATDREYKSVIESFERKKAFMESKLIEDKPADFARAPASVCFEPRVEITIDVERLEKIAIALSSVFRDYPEVQNSDVNVDASGGNRYLVNSEGTRLRTAGLSCSLSVNATVQCDDGMKLSDSFEVTTHSLDEWPPLDELTRRCRALAEQLIAVKNAPRLDEAYAGPVLFDAPAATAVISRQLARRFAGGQRPLGSRTDPNDFANKLEKRILPRFINIVDDPSRETVAGENVMGHYVYDDQGVLAEPVTLVEGGRLKALLMSRNPSKESDKSTGHGRSQFGPPRVTSGCLIVSADPGSDNEALREELLEACDDEDLEYGIRIASLAEDERMPRFARRYGFDLGRRGGGIGPLLMYKVYADGREELVRGAEIAQIGLKAFKRALAAGEDLHVTNTGSWLGGRTIAAPAMLFEELDLARIDRDFDKPPILPNPVARLAR